MLRHHELLNLKDYYSPKNKSGTTMDCCKGKQGVNVKNDSIKHKVENNPPTHGEAQALY